MIAPAPPPEPAAARQIAPAVDLIERADELVLKIDLPGTKADQIDLRIDRNVVRLFAHVAPRRPATQPYLVREFDFGDFSAEIALGSDVQADKVVAEFADGILTLRAPKTEAARIRHIPIRPSP